MRREERREMRERKDVRRYEKEVAGDREGERERGRKVRIYER